MTAISATTPTLLQTLQSVSQSVASNTNSTLLDSLVADEGATSSSGISSTLLGTLVSLNSSASNSLTDTLYNAQGLLNESVTADQSADTTSTNASTDLNGNWAQILKSTPQLASLYEQSTLDQGVIDILA